MTGEQKARRKVKQIVDNKLISIWGKLACDDSVQLSDPEYDDFYDKEAEITLRDWGHAVKGEMYRRRLIMS